MSSEDAAGQRQIERPKPYADEGGLWHVVKGLEVLTDVGMYVGGIAIVIMMFLITTEIVARSIFNWSTMLSDEYSGYLLVASTFLGAAYSVREGGFVRVEVVYDSYTKRVRWWANLFLNALALVFCVVVTWQVADYAWGTYRQGTLSVFVTRTPLWVPQSFMALGMGVLTLQMLAEFMKSCLRVAGGEVE